MEMTMRRKIITMLVVPLVATSTAQATAASPHHHTRTKPHVAASERLRNSNAYFAAPGNFAVQSDLPDYAEGAMTSGIAGH
jgi:hypothetical protein